MDQSNSLGDVRILNQWGTWSEMGYAHGYLLGPDIDEFFRNYVLEMLGGVSNYENVRIYFQIYFSIPPEFTDYSQGLVSGISDTISIYSDTLGRNIDYIDICVVSIPGMGGTIQTLIFMPEQLKMALAFATASTPSYDQVPEWIEWTDIFPNHPPQGIEGGIPVEHAVFVRPNPSSGNVCISCQGVIQGIAVFDIAGRKMDIIINETAGGDLSANLSSLPAGIYKLSVQIEDTVSIRNVVIIK